VKERAIGEGEGEGDGEKWVFTAVNPKPRKKIINNMARVPFLSGVSNHRLGHG
jgi:hypothetical protein